MHFSHFEYHILELITSRTLYRNLGTLSRSILLEIINLSIFPYKDRSVAVERISTVRDWWRIVFSANSIVHNRHSMLQVDVTEKECQFYKRVYDGYPLLEASLNRHIRRYSGLMRRDGEVSNSLSLYDRLRLRLHIYLLLLEFGPLTEKQVDAYLTIPYQKLAESMSARYIPLPQLIPPP